MPLLDINNLRLLHDRVLITDLEFGEQRTKSGIIIQDDDGTSRGIHPRWGKVLKVDPKQTELVPGDFVLLAHGRWTRAIKILIDGKEKKMYMMDYPKGLLIISKIKPKELELVGM